MDFLPDSIAPAPEKAEPRTRPGKMPPMTAKTREAVILVAEHGLEPARALQIISGGNPPSKARVNNLNKQVARWSIERPGAQKVAHSALLRFASGKDVNGIEPKATDVRACAERIIDQATPITRRTESVSINIECPVDLSRYGY